MIATKLFKPSPRHNPVRRVRLHDLLRQGNTLPLTLVVAPAGWGKSTLVADWLRQDDIAAGWVSLDSGDNDPKRFWRCLLLAAGQARPGTAAGALRRLEAAGSEVQRDVLPLFINELTAAAGAAGKLTLVLDDFHLVTSAQVHSSLAALVDRCPAGLHLVLITRADPPLQLSRLRVRGDLAEVRAEQLRFTFTEAEEFFCQRIESPLSPHDVQRLLARTEGWAAGLQLAALRLRDRGDPAVFIERFTGADWHIVNYLGEEVLASQPQRVREFLLVTSVLNRMCAQLCDALTGRLDGAELIDEINRANLFVIPLDEERHWFRYLSTESSVTQIAALENATYAPNLATAPQAGSDDPALSAREAIIPIVNGPRGVSNPQRQGLQSAVAGEGDPLNIIREEPECSDPTVPGNCSALEYSPLWDVHPVAWTQAAIDAGLRMRVTSHQDVEKLFDEGLLVNAAPGGPVNHDPEIYGLRAAGVVVNCPPIFVAPPA